MGSIPGWRFTFWLMFILAAVNWTLFFFFVPETVRVYLTHVACPKLNPLVVRADVAAMASKEVAEAVGREGALCERVRQNA